MIREQLSRQDNRNIIRVICLICTLIFLWTATSYAQKMAIPIEVQYPLFLKILTFDRNLEERVGDEIVIGIAYQMMFKGSLKAKEELEKTIKKSPIKEIQDIPIRQVSINMDKNNLESIISKNEVDILYIAPMRALDMGKITKLSRTKKILTLTGVPDYVESGITVGLSTKGGKPLIMVNLASAKAEGSDFSSQLLKLAKVIKK